MYNYRSLAIRATLWREAGEMRGAEGGKIQVNREGGEWSTREEGEGRIAD